MNSTTTRSPRRIATVIASLGVAGLLAACGASTPDATVTPGAQNGAATSRTTSTTTTSSAAEPTSQTGTDATSTSTRTQDLLASISVTPEEAGKTALGAVSSSRLIGLELDRKQGVVVWEVDLVTSGQEHDVAIDAEKGTVVANRAERDPEDVAKATRRLAGAKQTWQDALRIATDQVDGGRVVDLELDESDGVVVWEVDVIASGPTKHELKIDAATGSVRSTKVSQQ
jgi:uncharacterized membrane protein YkoI